MDKLRFAEALKLEDDSDRTFGGGIGTLGEKTLHRVLKRYISPYNDEHEIKIGSFVADIVNEDGIVEIQTVGFDKLRKKLDAFLSVSTVTLVYPVTHIKYLIWIDRESGEAEKARKSPKRGSVYDIFDELYKIKPQLSSPNLKLRLIIVDIQEYHFYGKNRSKRFGTERFDRIPLNIVSELRIDYPGDYAQFIPDGLPERFTSKDYSAHTGLTRSKVWSALNVLAHVAAIRRCGKEGRMYLYERV